MKILKIRSLQVDRYDVLQCKRKMFYIIIIEGLQAINNRSLLIRKKQMFLVTKHK